jgi:hypothetical protein
MFQMKRPAAIAGLMVAAAALGGCYYQPAPRYGYAGPGYAYAPPADYGAYSAPYGYAPYGYGGSLNFNFGGDRGDRGGRRHW